jgi:uncharacterized protein (TIGR01777 family)
MRALVTGGTGFIGRRLVLALRQRGDEVVIVSRRSGDGAVAWDRVEQEAARADVVVHLAGEPIADHRWSAARLERIRASRVDTAARIARAVASAARAPRALVSGSAVGIYGTRTDGATVDESAPPAGDVLARIVVEWEAAADPARAAGVRVVHPRVGVALGRGGGALEKMAEPFRWFVGGPIGAGTQWVSWVHVDDVVRAMLWAIDRDAVVGPANVVAPEPVTMNELARALGAAMHRPSALRVPALALKAALGDGLAKLLLTGQRAVPAALLAAGFEFRFPRLEPALADLFSRR